MSLLKMRIKHLRFMLENQLCGRLYKVLILHQGSQWEFCHWLHLGGRIKVFRDWIAFLLSWLFPLLCWSKIFLLLSPANVVIINRRQQGVDPILAPKWGLILFLKELTICPTQFRQDTFGEDLSCDLVEFAVQHIRTSSAIQIWERGRELHSSGKYILRKSNAWTWLKW